jgi:hypothetical protein
MQREDEQESLHEFAQNFAARHAARGAARAPTATESGAGGDGLARQPAPKAISADNDIVRSGGEHVGTVVAAPAGAPVACAAFAADVPSGAETVTASEGGFTPLSKQKAVLELAPELAECEAAVCHGREGASKQLAVMLAQLQTVQRKQRDELCATEGIVDTCHAVIEEGQLCATLYDTAFKIVCRQDRTRSASGSTSARRR